MSKRLSFLCIILVLSLICTAQAQTDINVVNPSFEWADEANQVTCHGGMDGVLGWSGGAEIGSVNPTWSGVDVNCGVEGMCTDCRDWHVFPDGNVVAYMDMGTFIFQLTDANITAGYKYTLTFDSMTGWYGYGNTQPIRASFYYLSDPCIPDYNHIELAQTVHIVTGYEYDCGLGPDECLDDWEYGLTAVFVAETGADYLGEKLGIKFGSPWAGDYPGSSWAWLDDISLSWDWATEAYDPSPEDEAELVTKNPTLTWKPGVYAYQHEVYFGTDETAVADANSSNTTGILEFDVCDVNNYTPTANPLVLGETYYWKITEVNDDYEGPLTPPWEGDVWSFRVEGHAYDPSPYDGEPDVIFLGLELEWTAGAEAENHLVYIGTDAQAVSDANTNSPLYKDACSVGNEVYPVGGELDVGQTYYWRIDEESNSGAHTVKGDTWSFTVGNFLVVENFESYLNNTELYAVWDDGYTNGSGALLYLEEDPNIIRDPAYNPVALNVTYYNYDYKTGSWFDVQDMTELDIGSDWTVGGVKALTLWMRGDPCTVGTGVNQNIYNHCRPWVEIEDTSSHVGYVLYPADDLLDVIEASWHEWNIDLGIIDACGVVLSAVDRFTVGIGGPKTQTKAGTKLISNMWFDDIRLYPPRCIPEYGAAVGNLTDGDCITDGCDLEIMATDWLVSDMNAEAAPPAIPPEVWYKLDDGSASTVVTNSGSWGSQYNIAMSSPNAVNEPRWITIPTPAVQADDPNSSLEFDGLTYDANGDILVMPTGTTNFFAGTQNMTVTAWVKRYGTQPGYAGVVCSVDPAQGGRHATGLIAFGLGGDELNYFWNEDYWQWKPGLDVPDNQWALMAVAVEPTQATAYVYDGTSLSQAVNAEEHAALIEYCSGCENWIGSAGKRGDDQFKGAVDDIRMYNMTLTIGEVMGIAGLTGEVYVPNRSKANIVAIEPQPVNFDPNNPDLVNFLDYDVLASHWLEEYLWPM